MSTCFQCGAAVSFELEQLGRIRYGVPLCFEHMQILSRERRPVGTVYNLDPGPMVGLLAQVLTDRGIDVADFARLVRDPLAQVKKTLAGDVRPSPITLYRWAKALDLRWEVTLRPDLGDPPSPARVLP